MHHSCCTVVVAWGDICNFHFESATFMPFSNLNGIIDQSILTCTRSSLTITSKNGLIYGSVLVWKLHMYICICKVIWPKAVLSLDMHYQGSTYLSLLDKRKEWGSISSPYLTEPVALWEIPFICTHRHRVLQMQLLSIPIPQTAPKLSQQYMGLSLHGNYKYCFSLSQ